MSTSAFQVTPLGGVAQIGSNMTLIETNQTRLIIDCGILFPYEDFFDINYLIPNMDNLGEIDALIITHGHEDHIGAITHVVEKYPDLKIYAPGFAIELMRLKLNQAKLQHKFTTYRESEEIVISDLTINPIHVNHSIPQTYGLFITQKLNSLGCFYVSDFKVDMKSPYEKPFDFEKLKNLSKDLSTRLLLSDSTNITSSKTKTLSEQDALEGLDPIFAKPGRIFLTSFSSNIHRVQSFVNLAAKYKRPIVLYGASMQRYSQIAQELGLLTNTDSVIKEANAISPDNKNLVVVCSGSQGEFKGTLRRVVRHEDPLYKPSSIDRFVFSSKAIPGNEKKLSLLFNQISELGATLHTDQTDCIHASGHPGKDDLKTLMQEYAPTHHAPIHGESLFLEKHEAFVQKNFPSTRSYRLYNFDHLQFTKNKDFQILKGTPLEPVLIHAYGAVIERTKISERRKLACNGAIFISLNTQNHGTSLKVTYNGIADVALSSRDAFENVLNEHFRSLKLKDASKIEEDLRIFTRRYFSSLIGIKPMTFVHFHNLK